LTAPKAPSGGGGAAMLVSLAKAGDLVLALGAGGGASAAALDQTALAVLSDKQPLDAALAQPRLWPAGRDLGRVNGASCPDGLDRDPTRCRLVNDPRGGGTTIGGS
jgi:hypothetical protein